MKRFRPNSIVIIEDNKDDVTLLVRQLRKIKLDNTVKFIQDGGEAHEYLSNLVVKDPEDLIAIFLDLHLPSMDGLALFREIRKMRRIKSTPVVVMTSSSSSLEFEECERLEVAKYLNKPISFSRFLQAMAIVLPVVPTPTQRVMIE